MREEFPNRCAKRAFSEQNHPFQATLLYSADEAFGVAVQIRRPGRQFHRFGAALGQSRQEFHCKEWIAIVNQIALALEQPVYGVGQMAGDLTHPHPVGSGRDPGNLDTSDGQFEKEQNQEALQPLSGPDLNGKEVCFNNLVPMLSEKLLPGRLPNSFGSRLDRIALQNVGNSAACQFMTEIRQRTLDAQITPGTVFRRHTDNQCFDFLRRRRATGFATRTAVVLVRDPFPVPAQQGLRRDNRCQFRQHPSSKPLGFGRETATLVVGEAKPVAAELSAKDSIFRLSILDRVLLRLIHPSGNGNQ